MKSDVILSADVFEKFIEISFEELDINPLYCVILPGYTYQCWLRYTNNKDKTLQGKDIILLLENNIKGRLSTIMGDRYVVSVDNKNKLYIDSNNLYGHSMSQPLPIGENKFDINVALEDILTTPDDSDIGYFVEVDLSDPYNIKDKTKNFPICPANKNKSKYDVDEYMKQIKPKTFIYHIKNYFVIGLIRRSIRFLIGC